MSTVDITLYDRSLMGRREEFPPQYYDHLAMKAKEGDKEAFEEIWNFFRSMLFTFIYYRLPDGDYSQRKSNTEDLLQKTFLRYWKSKERFVEGSIKGYLYKIAMRVLYNHVRDQKTKIFQPIEFFENIESGLNVEALVEKNEQQIALQEALSSLKGNQLLVVRLKLFSDMTNLQIAHYLTERQNLAEPLTEGAVKSLYSRAIVKLRNQILFNSSKSER